MIEIYPRFRKIYEDVYDLYLDMGKVMGMYSSWLREMDRNTVDLMIDEMQDTINSQRKQLEKKDSILLTALKREIHMYKKQGMSKEKICQRIQEDYQFNEDECKKYIDELWEEE